MASTSSVLGLERGSARLERPDPGFGSGVSPHPDHVANAPGRRAEDFVAGPGEDADVAGERSAALEQSDASAVQIELAQYAGRCLSLAVLDDALFGAAAAREKAAIGSGDGEAHSRHLVRGAEGSFKRRR